LALLERYGSLAEHYAGGGRPTDVRALVDRARGVEAVRDETRWVDVVSRSSRTGRWNPLGGYVGRIAFRGDLAPFRSWLAWGTLIHVGKSATRGNGWYRIVAPQERRT